MGMKVMFKKIIIAGCASVITIFATAALAADYGQVPSWKQQFYLQFGGGITWQFSSNWKHSSQARRNVNPDYSARTGYVASVGAGYALRKIPLRLSLNYLYLGQVNYHWMRTIVPVNDVQHNIGKVEAQVGMFNATYDFINHTRWTPFVEAGIGLAHISTEFLFTDPNSGTQNNLTPGWYSHNKLAWEIGTGVNYRLNPSWLVGVSTSYLDLGTAQFYQLPGSSVTYSYFNAVKLKNLSLMANITWRPVANNNGLNAVMIPVSGFHSPSASIWKRFYLQLGGGPAWQLSHSWTSTSDVPAIRSPNKTIESANIQGALAIGYAMQKWPLRFDLTYLYITQTNYDWERLYQEEQSSGSYRQGYASVNTQAGLLDVTYDFVNRTRWTPFISIGAGVAHISSEFSWIKLGEDNPGVDPNWPWNRASWHSKNNFVWQVASGVNYTLTSHWLMGIKANCIDLGKDTFYYLNGSQEQKHNTVNLMNFGAMINLTYRFN